MHSLGGFTTKKEDIMGHSLVLTNMYLSAYKSLYGQLRRLFTNLFQAESPFCVVSFWLEVELLWNDIIDMMIHPPTTRGTVSVSYKMAVALK